MIAGGDERAHLVWEAMVYQIGKAIGAMAAVVDFRPDGVILTGGMAHSERIVAALRERVGALGPVTLYPGSHESEALALGAARVLAGVEAARSWPVTPEVEALPW
jgi:butyrate kinase